MLTSIISLSLIIFVAGGIFDIMSPILYRFYERMSNENNTETCPLWQYVSHLGFPISGDKSIDPSREDDIDIIKPMTQISGLAKDTPSDIPLDKRTISKLRIYLPNGVINIREIQVLKDDVNIARDSTVTGTKPYSHIYPIENVNNGSLQGIYHSIGGNDQDVTLTFKSPVKMPFAVKLYNRTDQCCKARILGACVQILDQENDVVSEKIISTVANEYHIAFSG